MSRVASIDMKDSQDKNCEPDYVNSENSIIFVNNDKEKEEMIELNSE